MTTFNSTSTIADFAACPLSYYFRHRVNLRKVEDEASDHHLIFGAAMHEALAVLYQAKMKSARIDRPSGSYLRHEVLEQAKAAFLVAYPRQLDQSDNAKTRDAGCDAIDSWVRHYGDEDKRWRVLSVEAPDQTSSGFVIHLDMVAEDLIHGGIYGFDWKNTKKSLDYRYWAQYEPNSQITRYTDFIREQYGECQGFYIRAIQYGYRSRMYKGEPAGRYLNHEQQLFNVNDDKLEIERRSTARWLDLIANADQTNLWPMNTDRCQWCTYREICKAGWTWPRDEMNILNQYRRVCGLTTAELRPCQLDIGHDSPCSDRSPSVTYSVDDFNITVEV